MGELGPVQVSLWSDSVSSLRELRVNSVDVPVIGEEGLIPGWDNLLGISVPESILGLDETLSVSVPGSLLHL